MFLPLMLVLKTMEVKAQGKILDGLSSSFRKLDISSSAVILVEPRVPAPSPPLPSPVRPHPAAYENHKPCLSRFFLCLFIRLLPQTLSHSYVRKNEKIHFSCEIDQKCFWIKTQFCKLRVILRSRVLRSVCTLVKDTGR